MHRIKWTILLLGLINLALLLPAAAQNQNGAGDGVVVNPCLPVNYGTNWAVVYDPSLNEYFWVPEPGVTNESMTVGDVVGSDGLLEATNTGELNCDYFANTFTIPWPLTVESGYAIFFLNGQTPIQNGRFSGSVAFVPEQWGDEYAEVFATAIATYSTNVFVTSLPVDPYDVPFSVLPRRPLTYLSFDDSALQGDRGQLPTAETNISLVPSPFGTGVEFDSTSAIDLEYPPFQNDIFSVTEGDGSTLNSSGSPNVRANEGTVRFWFEPNWTSGTGPANGGVFFQIFEPDLFPSTPIWSLDLADNGSAIAFDYGGFSQPVSLVSNQWYEITATYSSTGTELYTNGVLAGSGGPVGSILSASSLAGFRIGSDGANAQVRGIMDEVRTYNYAMSASEVLSDYQAEYSLDTDGAGVPNVVQFEEGIDPSDPPGGGPGITVPTTASSAPIIQLLEPINAVQN
jgi:Concanavalin A-like lectin/glucanases superfamily